jgi:plasmid stability protein
MAALRERAARLGSSVQQEVLRILEKATSEPPEATSPGPIRLVKVKTQGRSTWRREQIYGDDGR